MVGLSMLHTFKNLFRCFSKYGPWAPELAFWDAYENSQAYWVSLPTSQSLITFTHAWLGAADLETLGSSPVSCTLLLVHFSPGIVHTAPSSHPPNNCSLSLFPWHFIQALRLSLVLQMFAVDLLDLCSICLLPWVKFLHFHTWRCVTDHVSRSLTHQSQIHSSRIAIVKVGCVSMSSFPRGCYLF